MSEWLESARRIIRQEAAAVAALERCLGPEFEAAVRLLLECKGRVVTLGMGKAGLIARKIAATLASTGTPSFFVHPAEGVHGDLGMITADDVVLALSNQGQTEEVLRVAPYLAYVGATIVAITSNARSELAKRSDVTIVYEVGAEACPMNLAPTTSTTAMLALGDALALVTLEARGFGPEDYARRHPGGSLGRRLLTRVSDIMHQGDENPVVPANATLQQAILEMTRCRLASTSVVDDEGRLVGFFTDGDFRRYALKGSVDMNLSVEKVMTREPKHATPSMMAVRALEILREHKIIELPVLDEDGRPIGLVHLHDMKQAGIA